MNWQALCGVLWVVALPPLLTPPALAETSCGFDRDTLTFAGSPLEQARCLLRHVRKGGALDPPLAALPAPLEDLVGRPVGVSVEALGRYLAAHGVAEAEVGGPLGEPLSRARDNAPDAPLARYFVIHGTSLPNLCEAERFPEEMDRPDWFWNRNEAYADFPQAHLFITRDGRSVVPQGRSFKVPWRGTKLERPHEDKRTKGLFLHIENVQPRLAEPEPGFPPGTEPDRRFYAWDFLEAGYVCRNDRLAPDPGLTDAQLDRLALVYVAASVRRGTWLIPAFHATVDADIPEAHDDPQNFDLGRWAARVGGLERELRKKKVLPGNPAEVRYMIEVVVSTDDRLAVLPGQSGNPDVILRNGPALPAELVPHLGVRISGHLVNGKNHRLSDERPQKNLEMITMARAENPVAILANDDHR